MKNHRIRKGGLCSLLAGLVLASALFSCSAPQYSSMMDKVRLVDLSARELRLRLNDLALNYAHEIESVADQIGREAQDTLIRQNALVLKASAIPEVVQSFFLSDPLAGLADSWTFNQQLHNYFDSENGQRDFGEYRELGLQMTRKMEKEFKELGRKVGSKLDTTVQPRVVYELAAEHPIESPLCFRKTTMPYIADLQGQEKRDMIMAVGEILDRVYDLREHLDFYMAHLPRQARWQGEILLNDVFRRKEIARALQDLGYMSDGIGRAVPVIEGLPLLADSLMKQGFSEVDRQRILVLYAIAQERALILEAISAERALILGDIERQRVETLDEVGRLREEITGDISVMSRELVDHLFLRLAQVLGGAILLIFLGIFLLRITSRK